MAYLININHTPTTPEILHNNKWRATDYYIFPIKNEIRCQAKLVIIDKQFTNNPEEAVVYLLQRYILEFEGWSKEEGFDDMTPEQFTAMVNLDGASFPETAEYYPIEDFTNNYNEVLKVIHGAKSFTITKNGSTVTDFDFLNEHDVVDVTCISDAWTDRQYFIETWTGWAFYTSCMGD